MSTTTAPVTPARQTPIRTRVSYEEFLAWAKKEDVRAEWVAGQVVVLPPNNLDHQRLLRFLNDVVRTFVRARHLGEVLFASVSMKLPSRPSGREPDLLFVAAAHADRLKPTFIDGPADLVVEIVSPESDARDHGDKYVEYEAAGIAEYWLIDPLRNDALFYQLGADGRYRRTDPDADGVYHSAVLAGLRLRVAWLWQHPLPTIDAVRDQIGL